LFLHHVALAYLMHCTIFLLAHICSYTLDHAKPELEKLTEQAQVEDPANNLALDQGKLRCIPPILLGFSFNRYNYVILDCALNL
jgi:hypothetical protein